MRGRLANKFKTNSSWTNWGGQTWQRLSAQIYLDRETIEEYGQRVLELRVEHRSRQEEEAVADGAQEEDRTRL